MRQHWNVIVLKIQEVPVVNRVLGQVIVMQVYNDIET